MRCALPAHLSALALAGLVGAASPLAQAAEPPPDLLTLAQGTIPLRVEAEASAKVRDEFAVKLIDGAPTGFAYTTAVPPETSVAFVYELAAPTVFERLAVPGVLETPSPSQSFARTIEVFGSADSDRAGFELIGSATLAAHRSRGLETELSLRPHAPVRWLRVRLAGALDPARPKMFLEFSELIGQGRQAEAPLSTRFGGPWSGRGVALSLQQEGPVVSGCYDRDGRLEGTVHGKVLHATGHTPAGIPSVFVAAVRDDGTLVVLRSTNGAPFHWHTGTAGGRAPACKQPAAPTLGCGAVVHGIRFEFDSAVLRPASAPLLDALHAGLQAAPGRRVEVQGHSSSEGEAGYNLRLSQQRAQAVVDALVQRGIGADRLRATGVGEARPLASNVDETGRSLNRRVEIHCDG